MGTGQKEEVVPRSHKYRFTTVAALAIILGASVITATEAQEKPRDILIGSGTITGVYYQLAVHTCEIVNKYAGDRYNCIGRPALGSVFNVNAVDRGLLDFGIVQSDSNWQAINGTADWEGSPVESLRSVFSAHPEAVLAVTRADTGIEKIEDFKGKTINIGNPGSGSRGNALDFLPLYGIDPNSDITAEGLQQSEASRALVSKRIDGFIYTIGMPNAAIEGPANSTEIDILDINSDAVKTFISDKPYYVMASYPDEVVKGVDAFETYATLATVVTSADLDEDVVYDYTKTVFENLDELKEAHPAFRVLEPADMLRGLSAPLHPGAIKYYQEMGWM